MFYKYILFLYSPCDEHFDTRYAIGTHHARDMRKLKKWSSLDAHPIYVTIYKIFNGAFILLKNIV